MINGLLYFSDMGGIYFYKTTLIWLCDRVCSFLTYRKEVLVLTRVEDEKDDRMEETRKKKRQREQVMLDRHMKRHKHNGNTDNFEIMQTGGEKPGRRFQQQDTKVHTFQIHFEYIVLGKGSVTLESTGCKTAHHVNTKTIQFIKNNISFLVLRTEKCSHYIRPHNDHIWRGITCSPCLCAQTSDENTYAASRNASSPAAAIFLQQYIISIRSQTCRPMMDTYIMTSDTMEAVPLVAAERGRKSYHQNEFYSYNEIHHHIHSCSYSCANSRKYLKIQTHYRHSIYLMHQRLMLRPMIFSLFAQASASCVRAPGSRLDGNDSSYTCCNHH